MTEGDAGTTTATFTVTLLRPSGRAGHVDYATADGTATRRPTTRASAARSTFAPGETT